MTVSEKLSELNARLAAINDLSEQAELIIATLRDHNIISTSEALPVMERLIEIARILDHEEYRAWALYLRSTVHHNVGQFSEAFAAKNQALDIFRAIHHPQGVATVTASIGLLYLVTGRYAEALESLLTALAAQEETGDRQGLATTHINIGNTYAYQGNYDLAIVSYQTAIAMLQEQRNERLQASVYFNMAFIQGQKGDNNGALVSFEGAHRIFQEMGDEHGLALLHIGRGSIFHVQQRYDEAISEFHLALHYAMGNENAKNKISSWSGLGRSLASLGRYGEAEAYLRQALDGALDADVKEERKVALQYLYELCKARGDLREALDYHEQYTRLDKEMTGKEAAEKLASMKYNYEIRQKEIEAEISQLRNVELKDALDRLQIEKNRSDELLLNILPAEVAEELKERGSTTARHFDEVTVLFTDFKGFTTISEQLSAQELVDELHTCFKAYDEIISRYNIEKIKTTGDAYLAVSGLPSANPNHAGDIILAAMDICEYMHHRRRERGGGTFEVRVGVHSGSVVAGIVGVKKFAYDIWGDTVNTAARMEQYSEAGRINISQTTYDRVQDRFYCLHRGKIDVKNKGEIDMYFVEREI